MMTDIPHYLLSLSMQIEHRQRHPRSKKGRVLARELLDDRKNGQPNLMFIVVLLAVMYRRKEACSYKRKVDRPDESVLRTRPTFRT